MDYKKIIASFIFISKELKNNGISIEDINYLGSSFVIRYSDNTTKKFSTNNEGIEEINKLLNSF
jgi:hypothetical protein